MSETAERTPMSEVVAALSTGAEILLQPTGKTIMKEEKNMKMKEWHKGAATD